MLENIKSGLFPLLFLDHFRKHQQPSVTPIKQGKSYNKYYVQ